MADKPKYRPIDTLDVIVKVRPLPLNSLGKWDPSVEERKELKALECVDNIYLSCDHIGWFLTLKYSGIGQMEDKAHKDKVKIIEIIAKWDQRSKEEKAHV